MAAYARMLLNRGAGPDGTRVLSEKGFALLTQRAIPTGEGAWYGYGITTSERDGRVTLSHSGGMIGYSSMLVADPEAGVAAVAFVNGPGNPGAVAQYAVEVARAALTGAGLPPVPPPSDPREIEGAADLAGTYSGGGATLSLRASGGRLFLEHAGRTIPLERRGDDALFANDPAFDRFLLRVEREGGTIAGLAHGATWYARAGRRAAADTAPAPAEWRAYEGHYRATHAWFNNFRVVVRRGVLYLVSPDGAETQMEPLAPGLFKETGMSAERLRFDSIVEGRALRANLSGVDYYRSFTP
jgi:hypothetical protein